MLVCLLHHNVLRSKGQLTENISGCLCVDLDNNIGLADGPCFQSRLWILSGSVLTFCHFYCSKYVQAQYNDDTGGTDGM